MSAYSWVVILLTLSIFGLLYYATYDTMETAHSDAYTGTDETAKTTDILWKCWTYLPLAMMLCGILYLVLQSQKKSGGF